MSPEFWPNLDPDLDSQHCSRQSINAPGGDGLLHPLERIVHGDKVDIVVGGEDLVNPELQRLLHLGRALQPGRVKVQAQRRPNNGQHLI